MQIANAFEAAPCRTTIEGKYMRSRIVALAVSCLALVAVASMSFTTTACSSGVCSQAQETKCRDTHTTCVPACGDGTKTGANGLPEPDPNYQSCVKKCGDDQCSCFNACGTTCSATKP